MTMTLNNPPTSRRSSTPARRLQKDMAAARVSFTWFGTRRTLNREQKEQAAETFGAEGEFVSAGKKLLDTSHPAFKAVTTVRGRALSVWRGMSLPFPEHGVRLIRRDRVESFDRQMRELKDELRSAVVELDRRYAELKSQASERLGSLYDASDYPPTLRDFFDLDWEYPTVEPPAYLLELSPRLYEEERQKIIARFDEAVRLAEQSFISELSKLVAHLVERLTSTNGEGRKVFRDSAIGNLRDFFERFTQLNVHSSGELDRLVETARQAVTGVEPKDVRDNETLRQQVATQLSAVQATLDGMMIAQPRRRILRSSGRTGE